MGKDAILATISNTAAKTAAAREKKKSKANATGFAAIWDDAVIDHFGKEHLVASTVESLAKLRRAMGRLRGSSAEKARFINSTVKNWQIISPTLFGAKAPDMPNLRWFVMGIDRYWSAFMYPTRKSQRADDKALVAENESLKLQLSDALTTIEDLKRQLRLANSKLKRNAELAKSVRKMREDLAKWD